MALTDMVVFNEQLRSAVVTKLEQNAELFNTASRNALVLRNAGNMGDFTQTSFWNGVQSALRDVDAYAALATETETDLSQDVYSTVKRMKAFGPIAFEPNQMTWIQSNPTEALSVISTSLADAIMTDQINTAVGCLVAAIENQASLTNDVSASSGVSQVALNNTHALFGDKSQRLTTQVMTGSVYHKLIGQNLANATQLFTAGDVTIVDILGKRTIITDAPDLYEAGAPNKEKILALQEGAVVIEPNGDFNQNIQTNNGESRIKTTYQAEYTENVGLRGYTWDETNGGKSPLEAELKTGTNWDIKWPIKQTSGVLLVGDAALS